MTVADAMTPGPLTVTPRTSVATALRLARDNGISRLPVVEHGRLIGVVREERLLAFTPSEATTLSRHELHDALSDDAALVWTGGDDRPLDEKAWNDTGHRAFGCLIPKPGRATAPLLLLFNASGHDLPFALPSGRWSALLDSADPRGESTWLGDASTPFPLRSHSVAVLRRGESA